MKEGYIGAFGEPNETELAEINKYTRRKLASSEVYAFSVVLCDNEVDRDFERFTNESLEGLAELFIGKTGIFDHSHKSQNQCARIFSCRAETVEGEFNSLGEPYCRLFARAYMPKSERSKELILDIDAGIKKEVSVGCSMGSSVCSICGEHAGVCSHVKGKRYKVGAAKRLCYFELCDPKDAYEWSFVAVPAQPQAGVIKSYFTEEINLDVLVKTAQKGNISLSSSEAAALAKRVSALKKAAAEAGEFLKGKRCEIMKNLAPNATDKASELLLSALELLSPEDLFKLYKETTEVDQPAPLQLGVKTISKGKLEPHKNNNFMI